MNMVRRNEVKLGYLSTKIIIEGQLKGFLLTCFNNKRALTGLLQAVCEVPLAALLGTVQQRSAQLGSSAGVWSGPGPSSRAGPLLLLVT